MTKSACASSFLIAGSVKNGCENLGTRSWCAFCSQLVFSCRCFPIFFSLPRVLDLDLLLNLDMVSWHVSGLGNDCYRCRRKGRSFCHKKNFILVLTGKRT